MEEYGKGCKVRCAEGNQNGGWISGYQGLYGSKVIWEHKGMLTKSDYVNRDMEKEIIYNMNGIYQPHNYIVTADGPDNDIDMEGIKRLVMGWLMPMVNM